LGSFSHHPFQRIISNFDSLFLTPRKQHRRDHFCAMLRSIAASSTRRLASTTASSPAEKVWQVYLSGEIHSDWRDVIAKGVESKRLPVHLSSPNTSHEDSDDCGAIILGMEEKRTNWDKIGAGM
jgi:hypothetical protein